MRLQELKSSGGVLHSVQLTLPEASGQVGEAPAAVAWEWLPGAERTTRGLCMARIRHVVGLSLIHI